MVMGVLTMRICLILLFASLYHVVSAVEVLEIRGPDAVLIEIYDVPVTVYLAHLQVDDDPEMQKKATELLESLVAGKKVKLKYEAAYGEHQGAGRVHLLKSLRSVNVKLIEAGLARYVPGGEDKYAQQMQEAEATAKTAKEGIWSDSYQQKTDTPTVAEQKPEEPEQQAQVSKREPEKAAAAKVKKKAPFCAELSGKYYYASNSREARRLNPRKIVYYKTEREAQRAGKKKPSKAKAEPTEQTMAAADKLMAQGEELYYKAVDMPVSDKRDQLYGDAFDYFTKAMLIYRDFFEKDQDNAKLGETLRQCMQLRYGAMKYKRP